MDEQMANKEKLNQQIRDCEIKLERANTLTTSLGDE